MKVYLEYILNAEMIYSYVGKLLNEMVVKEAIAEFVTKQASDLGFDITIDAASINAPEQALDENGILKKNEIISVLRAFIALDLNSFDEFSNFSDLTYVSQKVNETAVVEELLNSDWIYLLLGGYVNDTGTMKDLAAQLTTILKDELDIDFVFDYEMFMFRDVKYDLFVMTGDYNGYIKREEIKQLIVSGLRIDWLSLSFNNLDDVVSFAELLLSDGADGEMNMDVMLSSNILMALLDRVINVEGNQALNLDALYTLLANKYVPTLADNLSNLVVTEDLFDIRGVSNADGVLDKTEFVNIVEMLTLVDFNNLDANLMFDIFTNDENNNGVEDFEEFFESKILLSLITNLLNQESVRVIAVNSIEEAYNDLDLGEFSGISIDFYAYIAALADVLNSDGFFKYQDLRTIYQVLVEMNIKSVDDFKDIDLEVLTTLSNKTIYGDNYLRHIASIDLVRYMLDVTLKQEGIYEFASDYINDKFDILLTANELRIEGYAETNGYMSIDVLKDMLLAASAVEIKVIMDSLVTPAFLVNLLEKTKIVE